MKTCPNCHTQYTDDTLRFCLQDGTPLQAATRQPTLSLEGDEMETAARRGDEHESVATQWKKDSEVTRDARRDGKKRGASGLIVALGAAALIFLLLGGAAGIGLWLYFRKPDNDIVKNTDNGNRNQNVFPPFNINSNLFPSPTRTPFPTPRPTSTPPANGNSFTWPPNMFGTPTPGIDKVKASRDVSTQIGSWRYLGETGDLNGLIGKYASAVDYYNKRGASRDFIRADKQRAYRLYNSMSIRLSNMEVSVGNSGETATAVFDKEWVFGGASRSTGKVRQQLQFASINGQWLITSERDIKVYYTN